MPKTTQVKKWDIKPDLGNPKALTILSKVPGRAVNKNIVS